MRPVAGRAATEADEPPAWELEVPYKRTKLAAERLALAAGAVVVNPTTPVGDGDRKPTPTGRMIEDVARRPDPRRTSGRRGSTSSTSGTSPAGTRWRSSTGSRASATCSGGVDLSLEDLFAVIARLAGRQRPRLRVPYAVAEMAAAAGIANRNEVRLARLPMYFSSAKARSRLGYEPGPVEPASPGLAEALTKGGA